MGCCSPEKKPEENEIYSFFLKMEKEKQFNFTIEKYEDNYDIIINLSSNKFKKLKKKQQVRLGFVSEILKNINKIYTEEKEERLTKRILFYILILRLTLENYLQELKESNISNNNDLQQFLLTIIIKVLNRPFKSNHNLKLVLYYLANMLVILFSEIKDINNYFNIEQYINLINKITEGKEVLSNNEIYPFIRVNLYCLGECFSSNYPEIILNKDSINILIKYYVQAYFYNWSFLLENYNIFNKYLFFYNTNNNNTIITNNKSVINNHLSNKHLVNDLIYKNNNYLSVSNIKSVTNINEMSNYSLNQSRIINNNGYRASYLSNIEELSFNNVDFYAVIQTQDFQELQKITFSLYSFLKTTIKDTLSGKKIFASIGNNIEEIYNNINTNNNKNSINKKPSLKKTINAINQPEDDINRNISKIILLFLFNKCKIENDKIIVMSFLDFISDRIKEGNYKEKYYDILLQLFFLFNNEQIKQTIINSLSHAFIREIENQNTFEFIEELFGTNQFNNFYLFGNNKMKILKHFLFNMSVNIKEIQNTNLKIKIYNKLTDILSKYIKIYNKKINESNLFEISSYNTDNHIKYKLKKEDLLNLYRNFEIDHENIGDDKRYYFFFIHYIKFVITFSSFLAYNFICAEIFKDLITRKKAFEKLINFITELEILSIQGEKSYVSDIIKIIKLILKIIEQYSIDCFEDFQILCIFLGDSLKKLSKISHKHKIIDFHFLRLSYTILIFILIQLKKIFRLPNSMVKIHKEIIDCISNFNKDISAYLDEVNDNIFTNSKINKSVYQDLKKYLKEDKKFEIEPKLFRQIIDIIYSKLFGKTSSLFIFLESQNCKILMNEEKNDINEITEGNTSSFVNFNTQGNFINDISLKLVEEKENSLSLKENNGESQRINLPKGSEEYKDSNFNKKDNVSYDKELCEKIKI